MDVKTKALCAAIVLEIMRVCESEEASLVDTSTSNWLTL